MPFAGAPFPAALGTAGFEQGTSIADGAWFEPLRSLFGGAGRQRPVKQGAAAAGPTGNSLACTLQQQLRDLVDSTLGNESPASSSGRQESASAARVQWGVRAAQTWGGKAAPRCTLGPQLRLSQYVPACAQDVTASQHGRTRVYTGRLCGPTGRTPPFGLWGSGVTSASGRVTCCRSAGQSRSTTTATRDGFPFARTLSTARTAGPCKVSATRTPLPQARPHSSTPAGEPPLCILGAILGARPRGRLHRRPGGGARARRRVAGRGASRGGAAGRDHVQGLRAAGEGRGRAGGAPAAAATPLHGCLCAARVPGPVAGVLRG
jgi:hypothetical protein